MKRILLLALLAACVAAPAAHADGDPASDWLLATKVFVPFDVKFPPAQQAQFTALVTNANKQGFKIRVAIIASSYDMGSVTSLWKKPHTYATFLGEELSFLYKQRLLVVMPNGFGFNWPRHPTAPEYALLRTIPIAPGPVGELEAAERAVERLAAASSVHVHVPAKVTTQAQRNSHDRLLIILVTLGALAVAVVVRFVLRRGRRAPT